MPVDEPVTIITVAERAGVSKTTVSDALRGSGRLSDETRLRVLKAAHELGYVPNSSAQHLRRARTGTIGLHLPPVLTRSEYYMSFVSGVVQAAAEHDYDVTLMTSRHGRGGSLSARVDGLILGDPLAGDPVVEGLMSARLPTVTCERFPGDQEPDGVVWSEHGVILRSLLDQLDEAGASRPALIVAGDESDWASNLHRAYREWCSERGIAPTSQTVAFDSNAEAIRHAAAGLLANEPEIDALLCGPAGAATELLPVIREAGRTTGRDFFLASCVDSPAMRLAEPPITAIDLRPGEAGASCAALLFDLLSGDAPRGTCRIHPITLDVRASSRRER